MAERLNIRFTPEQTARLKVMALDLGCTQAEVLRRALALLKIAVDAKKEGCQLSVTNGDQVVKDLIGIGVGG